MMEVERHRLKVLLDYWIEHNREHGDEFKEWAEKAKTLGETEVSVDLLQAAGKMDQANEWLNEALGKLGSTS